MTDQSKPKIAAGSDAPATVVDEGAQDEIDQIMSEIEELQKEMNAAMPSESSAESPSEPDLALESKSDVPEKETHPLTPPSPPAKQREPMVQEETDAGELSAEEIEKEVLKEFSAGGGDEPWLEETLAALKTEPSQSEGGALSELSKASESDPSDGPEVIEDDDDLSALEEEDALEKELQEEKKAVEELIRESQDSEEDELTPSGGGTLALSVEGNIAVRINYGRDGKFILVHFTHQNLRIQLSDGTELQVPFRNSA